MSSSVYDTRVYMNSDWAVKRWDSLHGGKIVEPKSFCQFWRTVLLWCTLATFFPPLKKFAVKKAHEDENYYEVPVLTTRPKSSASKLLKLVGRTIAFPFVMTWGVLGFVVDLVTDTSRPVGKFLSFAVTTALLGVVMGLIVYGLYQFCLALPEITSAIGAAVTYLWNVNPLLYAEIVGFCFGIVGLLVCIGWQFDGICARIDNIVHFIKDVICNFFGAIFGILGLVLDGARVGHKKICPPMRIQRE